MSSILFGVLFLIAGLVVPFSRESMRPVDWIVMLCFLGYGIIRLFLSWKQRGPSDDIYRIRLRLEGIELFDPEGTPALCEGQRLFIRAYAGESEDAVHLMTEQGIFVACLPNEHKEHVLYKFEHHCPIQLVVRRLEWERAASSYTLEVELMC